MNTSWLVPFLKYRWATAFVLGLLGIIPFPGLAQITPDRTLGNEPSQVNRNVQVRGGNADRIEGGATRGGNLFHSFSEFNVNEGQRVYFANPSGVENILSRVTGRDVSDIMGMLGVEGSANLFLLNPNGIIFGPNARLDISGSFVSSTADSFTFPDGTQFSATNPGDPSLLSVSVPLGLQYGLHAPGSITNAGNLSVGQNLRLSGGSVTSTGQLAAPSGQLLVEGVAGDVQVRNAIAQLATFSASNNLILQESQLQTAGNLNLLAGNTVQMRDSVTNPFVAYASGNLTVQGNQNIDIFALNHPSSGLVSGGDMVLRSANTVGGDAHYWSGGNFRIEQLDGNLGNLYSPYDPVIRSNGDVTFDSYIGASLHIFAGGSVTIPGTITITGTDPINGLPSETVTLSNPIGTLRPDDQPTTVTIDGTAIPTLDIRAGTTAVGTPSLTPPVPDFPGSRNSIDPNPPTTTGQGTGADISIGGINFCTNIFCGPGQIFLTNQYSPNLSNGFVEVKNPIVAFASSVIVDSRGDIRLNGVDVSSGVPQAGSILLLSGGNILAGGTPPPTEPFRTVYSTGSTVTQGGPITFNAAGNITIYEGVSIGSGVGEDFNASNEQRNAGPINFFSNGSIEVRGLIAANNTNSVGNGGNITLNALNEIITGIGTFIGGDGIRVTTGLASFAQEGSSGSITLISRQGTIDTTRGGISSATFSGTGGNITLQAFGNITTGNNPDGNNLGIESFVTTTGNAGDVTLTSTNGSIDTTRGGINSAIGSGAGGNITFRAFNGSITTGDITAQSFLGRAGDVSLEAPLNIRIGNITASSNSSNTDGVLSNAVRINSSQGSVFINGASISTSNIGSGLAGDIFIDAGNEIRIDARDAIRSTISSEGNSGRIFLGRSSAETNPTSPNFDRTSPGSIIFESSSLSTQNVVINVDGEVTSTVDANTPINAGNIFIRATDRISFLNSSLNSNTSRRGNSGNVEITAGNELRLDSSTLSVQSEVQSPEISAASSAGNLTVNARHVTVENDGSISASNVSSQTPGNEGNRGNVRLQGLDALVINSGGAITASTQTGQAGNITIGAEDNPANSVAISGVNSRIAAEATEAGGSAGGLTINARQVTVADGASLSASNISSQTPGNVRLQGLDPLVINSGGAITASTQTGRAGGITIAANNVEVRGISSRIAAEATENGGSAGNLTVNARQVTVADDASISASNVSSQTPDGDIRLEELDRLVVESGGEITTSTRTGRAGDIGINENAEAATINENDSVVIRNGGRIAVSATGNLGEAGDLTIRTHQLRLNNGELSASATSGRAGDIEINANDSVIITSDGRIVVEANRDGGTAGGITIRTDQLRLNNSEVSVAATGNEGTAGGITIRTDQLRLNSSEVSVAATGNEGTAGAITVNARRAMLQNNSAITAETTSGRGGRIVLRRRRTPNGQTVNMNSLQVFNSRISAQTAGGQAGSLIIRANRVRIDDDNIPSGNNSSLSRQLRAQGGLSVEATESGGSAGNLTLNARQVTVEDGARISASNESSEGFNTGNVRLQGLDTLVVNSGGEITASTRSGSAGSVTINADESVEVAGENSRLAVEANGDGGTAGDLSITTNDLTLRDGSEATVNSRGVAGTLTIGADSIDLDDGEITAIAGSGNLGNINLDMSGTLLQLDNNSLISAGAEAEGSGGDLTINAENGFVLANPYGDSDVLANASGGAGGDIEITTNAIFGLQERNPLTDLSDINAASEFSTSGSIVLNTLNIDPTQGLVALPENVTPPNQIDQRCATGSGGAAGGQGEFVVSGRGGLPLNADESLSSDAVQVDLVTVEEDEVTSNQPASLPETDTTAEAIVEAQGWVVDTDGDVVLTAVVPTVTPAHSQPTSTCPPQQVLEQ